MRTFDEAAARHFREQFPGLARRQGNWPAVFLDGPAGTQAPQRVADAVSHALLHCNANRGGAFALSQEVDALAIEARRALADFVGAADDREIVIGPNMTALVYPLSRALAREWKAGDEIIVTATDHDANVAPWQQVAAEAGATVRLVPFRNDDYLVDLEALQQALSPRTRLVAVGCACNATGGVNPFEEISRQAKKAGAEVLLDAVHYAPHRLIDVQAWGCDWLLCSTYKFFGPHLGVMWGRRERLEQLQPDKLRPSSNEVPWRWMLGTPAFELFAGATACVDYLAGVGSQCDPAAKTDRRKALRACYAAIEPYETALAWRLIEGLLGIPNARVYGIHDRQRASDRLATVAFTIAGYSTRQLALELGAQGFQIWGGNYYALEFVRQAGLEREGMIRAGLVHYNLPEEVDRFVEAVDALARVGPRSAPVEVSAT